MCVLLSLLLTKINDWYFECSSLHDLSSREMTLLLSRKIQHDIKSYKDDLFQSSKKIKAIVLIWWSCCSYNHTLVDKQSLLAPSVTVCYFLLAFWRRIWSIVVWILKHIPVEIIEHLIFQICELQCNSHSREIHHVINILSMMKNSKNLDIMPKII